VSAMKNNHIYEKRKNQLLEKGFPIAVAQAQSSYELSEKMLRLRDVNKLTYNQIGKIFGVSLERARQLIFRIKRRKNHPKYRNVKHINSPIEQWFDLPNFPDAENISRQGRIKYIQWIFRSFDFNDPIERI
jgi:hypothetical protein